MTGLPRMGDRGLTGRTGGSGYTGRRTPDVLLASALRHWLSRWASPPESRSPAPAIGRFRGAAAAISATFAPPPRTKSRSATWRRRAASAILAAVALAVLAPPAAAKQPDPPELWVTVGDSLINASWLIDQDSRDYWSTLEYRSGTSTTWTEAYEGEDTQHVITGLNNGTTYCVRVRSNPSDWSGERCVTPVAGPIDGPPDPVTALKAAAGDREIQVQWNAPTDAASYRVSHHAKGYRSTIPVPVETTETMHTLTDLVNNAEYVISVVAVNSEGDKSDPATVEAIPTDPDVEPTPPSRILNVSLTPGDRLLEVAWTMPPDNGGLPIIGNKVEYSRAGGPWQVQNVSGRVTETTITGLRGSTGHAVRVSAINARGVGPASAPVYGTPLDPAVPDAPSVSTAPDGASAINVTWPGVAGATRYQVRHIHRDGTQPGWPSTFLSGTSHSITDLSPGRIYDIQVRACGKQATSSCGAAGSASEATVPDAVKSVSMSNVGATVLTLNWPEISGNQEASIEVGYNTDTSATSPNAGLDNALITTRSHDFSGLTQDTTYRFFARTVVKDGNDILTSTAWKWVNATTIVAPAAPGSLSATPDSSEGGEKIDVSWSTVTGASHYQIRHGLTLPAWGTTFQTATSYEITNLTAGRRYLIEVRACEAEDTDTCGGAAATQGATNPSAPESLGTSGATVTGMTLTWTNPSSGHNESEVEAGYSATSGDTTPNAGQAFRANGVATHSFSGLNGGIEHKFFARTVVRHSTTNAVLTASAWQSETGTTTKPDAPTVTANTSTTNGGSEIDVIWGNVTGATRYQIRHVLNGSTQPGWPSTFVTSPQTLGSLSQGRIYDIEVRACGSSATSSCGTAGSASEATEPDAVASFSTSNVGATVLTLNWPEISGNEDATIEVGYNTNPNATSPDAGLDNALITAQSYTFSGLTKETAYRFFARTVVKDGNDILTSTPWQGRNETTTDAPAAPENLSATPDSSEGGEKIDVSWSAVTGASHYQIRHGVTLPAWGTSFQSGTTFSMTNLTAGRRYLIEVRACETQSATTCGVAAATQGATNVTAPTSLDTSGATVTGMTLTWTNPSSGHDEAEVEVGYSATSSDTTPNAGQAFKANGVATHTFSGLNGGIEHNFFARTVVRHSTTNAVLTSSAWQSETDTTTKPGAPTVTADTSTTNGGSEIDVTWPTVTGASAYQLRHIHSGGTQPGWPTGFVSSPQTLGSLSAGRIYDIQVRACGTSATSSCGATHGSASEATVPTAVENLGASNIGAGGLTLTWQQISGNNEARIEVGYDADISATEPTGSTVAEKAITAQNHAFSGLAPSTTYRFFARTIVKDSSDNVLTESAWQALNQSTTAQGAPSGLSATAGDTTKIDVDWDDDPDATHYQIRHKLSSTSAWPGWGDTSADFFTDSEYEITSLSAGRRYDIQVRGCTAANVANCGGHSEVEGAPQPTTPTSVSTSVATATGMTLTWQAISTGNNEAVLEVGYNDDTSASAPDAGIAELTAINTAESHAFSGLSGGVQYKFFVRTKVKPSSGDDAPLSASAWQSENGTTSLPAKPAITAETDGTDRTTAINVNWSTVAGATRYQVRHIEDDGSSLPAWGTSFLNGTTHRITGLSTGRRYRIEARACGAAAAASCGAASDAVKEATDPTAISSLDKSSVNAAGVTLTWSQISGNNEATIQVGYNTDTGAGTTTNSTVTDKAISSQNHAFSGLAPGTSHKFFARTVVKDGNTVLTETAWQSLTESTSALGSPGPSAAADGTTKIDATWTAVTDATHYQVRRKLGSASDWPGSVTIPLVTLEAPPIPSSPCTSPLPAAGISCLSTFSPFLAGAGVSRG